MFIFKITLLIPPPIIFQFNSRIPYFGVDNTSKSRNPCSGLELLPISLQQQQTLIGNISSDSKIYNQINCKLKVYNP